jgi:predicted GIY-YIG superfamily endonuclease
MPWRPLLPVRSTTRIGVVYLLHFERPFGQGKNQAQHYCGFTLDEDARYEAHLRGWGARLVAHVLAAGIGVRLAAVWKGVDQTYEYKLKNRGSFRRWCPVCRGAPPLA